MSANPHVLNKFEGFEPEATGDELIKDCGNCLSYQPGTIVCRCDECDNNCKAWDPIPETKAKE